MRLNVEMIAKNKLKRISKSYSKDNNFEEYKNCLDGEENENEFDNYNLGSINQEMYLQKIKNLHFLSLMINDVISKKLEV